MTESRTIEDPVGLVRAARSGDDRALERLAAQYLPLVYNVIGRALDGHADVDDLVQETMIQFVRGLPDLREPERFRSWLVAIAYRQVQLHLRNRQRSGRRQQEVPAEVADPRGDFVDRTVTELVLTGQRRELADATRWLDERDRHLLALWWQEASGTLSRAELAAALGVAPAHAAVRVQRMRAQLEVARSVVRALRAEPRCAGLDALVRPWHGTADGLWRKRLARHVRGCPDCGAQRTGLVAPEQLLRGLAAVPLPLALETWRVAGLRPGAGAASGAGTGLLAHLQHAAGTKLAAGAAVVIAGGGIAFAVYETPLTDGGGPVAAPPPAATATVPPPPAATGPTGPVSAAPSASAAVPPPGGTGVTFADIYVAPGGSDAADGTAERPFATLGKAVAVVRPGQTIALRGGTYRPAAPVTIGTSGDAAHRITLSAYGDERPVIDAAGIPSDKYLVTQRASYWTVQGIEVRNAPSHAWVCFSCRYNTFQRLTMRDNASSGLTLRDPGTVGNQVLNSDFLGRAGIGLGIKFGDGEGNVVRGCRLSGASGDGVDLGAFTGAVTLEYNWAWGNGKSGFNLGGGDPPAGAAHKLRHNAAWDNARHGFADDGNPAAVELQNNTAFRNRGDGFDMTTAAAVLRSNVAVGNASPAGTGAGVRSSRNTWDEGSWDASMFSSTDPAVAQGPRRADGTVTPTDFLRTGNGMGASMSGG
ncbi:sigma-70 family RNA polymerase sigma factor [Dactylosporangium sp. NPDC005572]|uniref:sigma-70 family RNA polymerase sigma factor n=1 Tax=Dactylosporangium sp. NPDC005572 TaxID=3156889 RepID=UPI0033B1A852